MLHRVQNKNIFYFDANASHSRMGLMIDGRPSWVSQGLLVRVSRLDIDITVCKGHNPSFHQNQMD